MKMYNILGVMKGLNDNAKSATQLNESVTNPTVYEPVEPKGSIMQAVKSMESKFATFKEGIEDKIEAAREKAAAKGKIKDTAKEEPKSASRLVKGKAYGGSAQKDAEEKDDLDEGAKPDFLDVDKDGNKAEPFKKAVKDKKAVEEGVLDQIRSGNTNPNSPGAPMLDRVRNGTLGQSTSHKNFDPKTGRPLHTDSYSNAAIAKRNAKEVEESTDASAQKGAQAILQALSPEEEQELAAVVKQAGNNPAAVVKALGITPELIQQAEQGQVAEGIAPTLGGKVVQALYTAGLLGTTVGAIAAGSPYLGLIAAPLLMAAGTIYGGAKGQVGHNPEQDVKEGQGPYELYNPKHPKFKANYDKWMAKNPGKTLSDFIEAMKKREHGVNETQELDELVRVRPQANFVSNKFGGYNQASQRQSTARSVKDTRALNRKTGGPTKGAKSGEYDAPWSDKVSTYNNPLTKAFARPAAQGKDVNEVAPPGAKAERMVKGIKKSLSKDGHLSNKDKAIAYATAWKAHNKGQVEENVQFGDTVKNSTPKLSKVKPMKIKESRMIQEGDYYYESIGKALAEKNPHLDTASGEFVDAVRKEMVAQGMKPNQARNILTIDEDFLMDVASSYGHYCKIDTHQPLPAEIDLGGAEELDEIAKLAGLPTKQATCETCGMLESSCGCSHEEELDEREQFQSMPRATSPAPIPAAPAAKPGISVDKSKLNPMREEEVEEGNEFSGALAAAKASGSKEFEVDGKKYTVKEDINVNITANGQEDALNLFRKLAGMDEVAPQVTGVAVPVELPQDAESAIAQGVVEPVEVEVAEERDIEYTNTPNEKIAPPEAAFPNGTDLNRAKKQFKKEYPGDNPMAVKEEALWKSYESLISSIKD